MVIVMYSSCVDFSVFQREVVTSVMTPLSHCPCLACAGPAPSSPCPCLIDAINVSAPPPPPSSPQYSYLPAIAASIRPSHMLTPTSLNTPDWFIRDFLQKPYLVEESVLQTFLLHFWIPLGCLNRFTLSKLV
jgi:hypothetical protein